jgi:hypothetical protein
MTYIFIAYSFTKYERPTAERIRDLLEAAGMLTWLAPVDPSLGPHWWSNVEHRIKDAAAFLILETPVNVSSSWLKREYNLAEKYKIPMFSLSIAGPTSAFDASVPTFVLTTALPETLPDALIALLNGAMPNAAAPDTDTAVVEASENPTVPPHEQDTVPTVPQTPSVTESFEVPPLDAIPIAEISEDKESSEALPEVSVSPETSVVLPPVESVVETPPVTVPERQKPPIETPFSPATRPVKLHTETTARHAIPVGHSDDRQRQLTAQFLRENMAERTPPLPERPERVPLMRYGVIVLVIAIAVFVVLYTTYQNQHASSPTQIALATNTPLRLTATFVPPTKLLPSAIPSDTLVTTHNVATTVAPTSKATTVVPTVLPTTANPSPNVPETSVATVLATLPGTNGPNQPTLDVSTSTPCQVLLQSDKGDKINVYSGPYQDSSTVLSIPSGQDVLLEARLRDFSLWPILYTDAVQTKGQPKRFWVDSQFVQANSLCAAPIKNLQDIVVTSYFQALRDAKLATPNTVSLLFSDTFDGTSNLDWVTGSESAPRSVPVIIPNGQNHNQMLLQPDLATPDGCTDPDRYVLTRNTSVAAKNILVAVNFSATRQCLDGYFGLEFRFLGDHYYEVRIQPDGPLNSPQTCIVQLLVEQRPIQSQNISPLNCGFNQGTTSIEGYFEVQFIQNYLAVTVGNAAAMQHVYLPDLQDSNRTPVSLGQVRLIYNHASVKLHFAIGIGN